MDSLYDALNETSPALVREKCQYKSRLGTQCSRNAIDGEHYCVLHGASIERAKDTITRRLVSLQEKSVTVIEELLSGDDKTRLAAATAVLDRTGLGPKSTISLDTAADLSKLPDEQLVAELDSLTKTAKDVIRRQRMNDALMKNPSASNVEH